MANHTGNCPGCGAPIFSELAPGDTKSIPQTVFTCPCHKFLQLPKQEPVRFIPQTSPTIPPITIPHYPWNPWVQPTIDPFIVWSDKTQVTCQQPFLTTFEVF
jgi:hypothetical protein